MEHNKHPLSSLIRLDGTNFNNDIQSLTDALQPLDDTRREAFRDTNAREISICDASRLLVVAGPGAGKSSLFISRIKYWLALEQDSRVYLTTFIRRLVKELRKDTETKLEDDEQRRVTVTTLHGLARSILERSHGTSVLTLRTRFNIVTDDWPSMIWSDACAFHDELGGAIPLGDYEVQWYNEDFLTTNGWPELQDTHRQLSILLNAVGFAELIHHARMAIEERPELNDHQYWIIDEYQDFNASEDQFIKSLTYEAKGVLIAGDDEQALYQRLKQSHPEIILGYYDDDHFAKAILPFCGRCGYWICEAASSFIANGRPADSIAKVFLPVKVTEESPRVRVVATSTPGAAVDYIQKFIEDREQELQEYEERLADEKETDPFLLILTPEKHANFYAYKNADDRLLGWLAQWTSVAFKHSSDYKKIGIYFAVAMNEDNNYALRRVLHFEGLTPVQVHPFLAEAIKRGVPLSAVSDDAIDSATSKCREVAEVLIHKDMTTKEKVIALSGLLHTADSTSLAEELEGQDLFDWISGDSDEGNEAIETADTSAAVEMTSIVGSKGLSAQHVMVIGFDDSNMRRASRLEFFVALTRARKSLHLITSLSAGGSTGPHQFLDDIPPEYCVFLTHAKTGRVTKQFGSKSSWLRKIESWTSHNR
jgi:superfamily I DNA/RNA helicase